MDVSPKAISNEVVIVAKPGATGITHHQRNRLQHEGSQIGLDQRGRLPSGAGADPAADAAGVLVGDSLNEILLLVCISWLVVIVEVLNSAIPRRWWIASAQSITNSRAAPGIWAPPPSLSPWP